MASSLLRFPTTVLVLELVYLMVVLLAVQT